MILPASTSTELRIAPRASVTELPAPAPATPWRSLLGWLLVGLALRALLLPLAVHPDLLAMYDRTRLLSQGTLHWFDLHLQALPIAMHWLFAKLFGMALPVLDGLHWPTTARDVVYDAVAREMTRPGAWLDLSLLKLPYVLADLGCGVICWRLAAPAQRLTTLRAWMLHPFLLFVSALFGKYEAFMALPLLLGWLQLRRGRDERAFLLFGVAIAMRLYPVLFVLPMALCAGRSLRRRAELLALSLLPTLLVLACCATHAGVSWLLAPPLALAAWRLYLRVRGRRFEWLAGAAAVATGATGIVWLAGSVDNAVYPVLPILRHAKLLVQSRVALSTADSFLLFLGAWGLVLLWALRQARLRVDAAARADDAADAGLLATLAFVAFGSSLPQYEYLLVPLVLLQLHRLQEIRLAHAVQLAGLLLLLLDSPDGDRTTLLFLPVAPDVVALTRAPQRILFDATWNIPWVSIGRTLLVLGAAWMAVDLLRVRARRDLAQADRVHGVLALRASALAWPVGLLGLLALVLTSPGEEPVAAERDAAVINAARPLDGYEISIGDRTPTLLRIRLEDGRPVVPPGHRIRLVRVDAGRRGATADDDQDLVVPASSLIPDEQGALEIDLSSLALAPNSRYVARWEQRDAYGTASGAKMRLLKEVPQGVLLGRFLDSAKRRLLDDRACATWLAGALLLALAGVVLVAGGARGDRGAPELPSFERPTPRPL